MEKKEEYSTTRSSRPAPGPRQARARPAPGPAPDPIDRLADILKRLAAALRAAHREDYKTPQFSGKGMLNILFENLKTWLMPTSGTGRPHFYT